jgi:diguanylate cyclase (GGDEF)-like protein
MNKDDLKSIVSKMYEDVLEQIDTQEDATKEQLVNYLKDAVEVVSGIDVDNTDSIENVKLLFTNRYKEIAERGIESYRETNSKFEELTIKHEETINECFNPQIDMQTITEKFNEIQFHLSSEVKKANSVIASLTNQVKVLEETSNIDALTQVFNRRALTAYLNTVCEQEHTPEDMHILVIDLDDFKDINDKYGHVAGDKILIFIANILRKTLRDGDKVFRYGGEEFVIILNRIDHTHCKKISSRLLKLVSDNKLIYKGENIHVTMSIGTTELVPHDTPDSLITRADKALYIAKENGKNRMHTEVKNGN